MAFGDTSGVEAQAADAAGNGPGRRQHRFAALPQIMKQTWTRGLDLILPPLCLGCETRLQSHDALCPSCWREIDFIRPPLCDRLGIPLPYDAATGDGADGDRPLLSAAAVAMPPAFDRARAVARYDGLMRTLVHDFKFRDTHNARRLFGRWLVGAGQPLIDCADVIVPVPLARLRLLSRRFNQAQLLATEVHRLTGKPVAVDALKRTRRTAHQVGLTRRERERNVKGAFSVAPGRIAAVSGRSVLLIDDVMTTGATAEAAARALKSAGAAGVDVLVLALVTDTVG